MLLLGYNKSDSYLHMRCSNCMKIIYMQIITGNNEHPSLLKATADLQGVYHIYYW